jgi:hypothetical protein
MTRATLFRQSSTAESLKNIYKNNGLHLTCEKLSTDYQQVMHKQTHRAGPGIPDVSSRIARVAAPERVGVTELWPEFHHPCSGVRRILPNS